MSWQSLLENPTAVCLYFAVVLVLLLLVIMQLWKVGYYSSEHQVSHPVKMVNQQNTLFNGGRYSTELSGANGPMTSGVFPGLGTGEMSAYGMENYTNPFLRDSEYLVNNRGEPDFWTITSDLQDYQMGETTGMAQAAKSDPAGVGSDSAAAAADAAQAAGASPVAAAAAAQGAAVAAAQPAATPASVGAAAQSAAAAAGAPAPAAVAAGAAASERFRSEGFKGLKLPWARDENLPGGFQKVDLRTSLHGRPSGQETFEGTLENALFGR